MFKNNVLESPVNRMRDGLNFNSGKYFYLFYFFLKKGIRNGTGLKILVLFAENVKITAMSLIIFSINSFAVKFIINNLQTRRKLFRHIYINQMSFLEAHTETGARKLLYSKRIGKKNICCIFRGNNTFIN